ncbi:hypothetical protein QZH41_010701, partial [Actinostola sp. cb2023]
TTVSLQQPFTTLTYTLYLGKICQDDMFIPLYPDHGVIGYGHDCDTKIKKLFTLVDSSVNIYV